jgi:S1-C subfamily serine protease
VNAVDGIVIAWMVVWAVLGSSRGLVEQVLSLTGLVVGALAGSRLAPLLLPEGRESIWLPLVSLAGAIAGATLAQALLLTLAGPLRRRVAAGPARRLDQGGGVVMGAALGLALAWLIAAVALYQPGDRVAALREEVQRSSILSAALRALPPDRVLGALARVDPFPLLPLPAAALPGPDPSVSADATASRARVSLVQVRGRACGLVKQGTGWVVAGDLVVTNAHVVAGQRETQVLAADGRALAAQAVFVDGDADVALMRVDGLGLPALPLGDAPSTGDTVVLMGFPGGGGLTAETVTASSPRTVLAPDAYGRGRQARSVVVTRGSLGPGSSGGPVLDRLGRVRAMIFGGSADGGSGAAVPPAPIRAGLRSPLVPVSTGPCA